MASPRALPKLERGPRCRRASGPGRPRNRDPELVRSALLAAARRQVAAHGTAGTSLAAIAREAGVTAAMVHYHFGDKQGLYQAMLEQTVGPVLAQLGAALSTSAEPDSDGPDVCSGPSMTLTMISGISDMRGKR